MPATRSAAMPNDMVAPMGRSYTYAHPIRCISVNSP